MTFVCLFFSFVSSLRFIYSLWKLFLMASRSAAFDISSQIVARNVQALISCNIDDYDCLLCVSFFLNAVVVAVVNYSYAAASKTFDKHTYVRVLLIYLNRCRSGRDLFKYKCVHYYSSFIITLYSTLNHHHVHNRFPIFVLCISTICNLH